MAEQKPTGYPSIDKPWMKYYDKSKLDFNFPKMNVYDYLKKQAKGYENYTAITYFGMKITYSSLFNYIDEAAKALYGLGVRQGTGIMYLIANIPEAAFLFYGGAKIGAVSDYIDPRPDSIDFSTSAKKMLPIIKEEKPQFIIALDQCYLAMLKPIEKDLKSIGIKQVVILQQAQMNANLAQNKELMENAIQMAAQIEQNTARAAQYAQISAAHEAAQLQIAQAEYWKLNKDL